MVTRVVDDIRTRLELISEVSSAALRRSMVGILGTVWAGAAHMLHGHLDWISRQIFADTAELASLIRQAAPYDLAPNPPAFATGQTVATGTNGTAIPINTRLRRADGAEYSVTAGVVVAGGTATLAVEADLAGTAADCDDGTVLTFESPIAGVASDTTVGVDGISGGTDAETADEFRSRYVAHLQDPPQGGSDPDYVAWAREIAGVTRAWTYPNENGLGTVTVRFVRDDDIPIIPTLGEVATVQAKLEDERPITAEVTALAPVALSVNFTVHLVPSTAETKAAVEAELDDLFQRLAEPGDGLGRGAVLISQIRTAIGTAGGIVDYTLTVPAGDVTPAIGELAVRGTMTYV